MFPSVSCAMNSSSLFLTFDDGPHPIATPTALEILRSYNIKATFFLLGMNIKQYPSLVKDILDEGHTIGNHGFSHTLLTFKSQKEIEQEITSTTNELFSVAGTRTAFFRPPYGGLGFSMQNAVRSTHHRTVLWSRDTRDWANPDANRMISYLHRTITQGDILLFHDNELTASYLQSYLPKVIEHLRHHQFQFSALSL